MHSAFFRPAHIASEFTCVYCAAAGTIYGTTDVYELRFSYLSISIFILNLNLNLNQKAILIIGAILTPWKILLKGLHSDEFEYHASNREVFYSNLF